MMTTTDSPAILSHLSNLRHALIGCRLRHIETAKAMRATKYGTPAYTAAQIANLDAFRAIDDAGYALDAATTEHALVVGVPWRICGWSDVTSATLVEVSANRKRVTLQHCHAKLLNGANSGRDDALRFEAGGFLGHTSGRQDWELTPDPSGTLRYFSLRKNGRWVEVGVPMGQGSALPGQGHYHDFNF